MRFGHVLRQQVDFRSRGLVGRAERWQPGEIDPAHRQLQPRGAEVIVELSVPRHVHIFGIIDIFGTQFWYTTALLKRNSEINDYGFKKNELSVPFVTHLIPLKMEAEIMDSDTGVMIVTEGSGWKILKKKRDLNIYGTNLCLPSKHSESCQKHFHTQRNNFEEYLS